MPPNPTPREPLAAQLRQAATELEHDHHDLDDDGLCGLCDDDVPCWYTRTADVMRDAADALARTQAVVEAAQTVVRCYDADDWDDTNPTFWELFEHLRAALAATHPAGGPEAGDAKARRKRALDEVDQMLWREGEYT